MQKRGLDSANEPDKRQKLEGALVLPKTKAGALTSSNASSIIPRTSQLMAPTVLLSGHDGEVFTCKFSPDGEVLASGSFDKKLFLWRVFGACDNYAVLKGHTNAILELHWSPDGENIISTGPDRTIQVWDVETLVRVKKIKAHETYVNSCSCNSRGQFHIVSGSDDNSCKVWDARTLKKPAAVLQGNYPVTSVAINDAADKVFACDVAGNVEVWDVRKDGILFSLQGHLDVITGCSLDPQGHYLLTNSMDNTVRCWDIRPYVVGGNANRCIKTFVGHSHGVDRNLLKCSWSSDGAMVAAGSSDCPSNVYIWDFNSRKVEYKLPGHRAAVNEVVFHPKEPIVASCSSDKSIYLGELIS
eukprot:NODE_4361_length_1179_cov_58.117424_g3852_i0.p1 GENE.NODE_4361_length_1179_cov_58.117424_g3852_i0~~NODE_4361_length_1179_cov_58.117424_g3852_i0.p1  ORF type:complete len:357 (-),score=83.39 NODE_4361_length_1179_cov_58.117424_g3852_i0:53-1123(-)